MKDTLFQGRWMAAAGISAVIAVGLMLGALSEARGELIRHGTPGALFANYYVPPVGPNSVGAQLYPCPRPTPPLVGHTYITYEPLDPHEFLYRHNRVYWTAHADAPPTRTSVHWGTSGAPLSRLLAPPKVPTTLKLRVIR